MTFIHQTNLEDSDESTQKLFKRHQDHYGFVPNYTKLYKNRVGVMDAWSTFLNTIKSNINLHEFELITLAAAMAMKNSYCSLAHAKILNNKYYNESELEKIVFENGKGVLTKRQILIMSLARKVAKDANEVTQEDINNLKQVGCSDEDIFDVVTTAAARCFFSKVADSLGAQPDPIFHECTNKFKDMFVVGRSISTKESAIIDKTTEINTVDTTL
jgi:uncharacterized peroxidase-related enzyme